MKSRNLNSFCLDTCPIKSTVRRLISTCYDEYSTSIEEKGSFLPGWSTNETAQNYSSLINKAFIYQTSEQLDTYIYFGEHATYGSGGYVYEFRDSSSQLSNNLSQLSNDLSQLHQLGWIDRQTRAVIIQMNLYNPTASIFTSGVIIVELLPSSRIFPSARFEPLHIDGNYSYLT